MNKKDNPEDAESISATSGETSVMSSAKRELEFFNQKEVFRQILDAIDDMVLVKGDKSRIVWANKAFRDYYNMSNEQLRNIIDAPFNDEGNTKQYIIDDNQVYTTGETLNIPAEKVTRHDGLIQLFNTIKSPLFDQDKKIRLTVGVSRNITEQKEIEEELAQHQNHLEQLVEERTKELLNLSDRQQVILRSLAEGIIAVDPIGHIVLMNSSAEHFTGHAQKNAVGLLLQEVLELEDEKTHQKITDLTQLLRPDLSSGHQITAWIKPKKSNEARLVSITISPLIEPGSSKKGFVLAIRDISMEREIEEQNIRNQKLESLGLLAGGIAHDFNNLLMTILGNLSLARDELGPNNQVAQILESAEAACHRARGLSTQLLTFSQGGAPLKKVLRLEAPIREAADLALRGSAVRLNINVENKVSLVEADEGQLVQAVNNLVLNAKQAMTGRGDISITLKNVSALKENDLPVETGEYVLIQIQDSGPGVPVDHMAHIFDPYFTTKPGGSGLGLTSAYSIVARHDGHLSVSSRPNQGCCFSIYLPASTKAEEEKSVPEELLDFDRTLNVLALDDEDSIRIVLKRMLSRLGHDATITGTSKDALKEFSNAFNTDQPFDLVCVDLTMPGDLSGEEVIQELRAIHPSVRVVIMSGYSTSTVLTNYKKLGISGALVKPFDIETVRDLLARLAAQSTH